MYSLPTPGGRHGRAIAVTGSPAAHRDRTPVDQYWPTALHPLTGTGAGVVGGGTRVVVGASVVAAGSASTGSAGHSGIRPMLASVLTDAVYVPGAVASGRASHGARGPTLTRNSACGAVSVAAKSNEQFHCPPPADMSSHRLAVIDPTPISVLSSASST